MNCILRNAEINHLRRLLGWVACEVGQAPDDLIATVRKIAPGMQDISEEGKAGLMEALKKAEATPKYVRAAIKALSKTIQPHLGDIVDGESVEQKQLPQSINPAPQKTN